MKIWESERTEEIASLKGESGGVTCMSVSPDQKTVAFGSFLGDRVTICNLIDDSGKH